MKINRVCTKEQETVKKLVSMILFKLWSVGLRYLTAARTMIYMIKGSSTEVAELPSTLLWPVLCRVIKIPIKYKMARTKDRSVYIKKAFIMILHLFCFAHFDNSQLRLFE